MEREILSRDNPAVKQYVRLASSAKARREETLFVTEGARSTREAFDAGCPAVRLYATEQAMERYADRLDPVALGCEQFLRVTEQVAEKLAQTTGNQGVFGLFRPLDNGAQPVKISKEGCYLLLSSLQDPGNTGGILRTAAAFGADGVFLSPDCPDLYSPKVLRGAMGGGFKLPVVVGELPERIAELRQTGVRVYAAALRDTALPVHQLGLGAGCAVLIGNEGAGLSEELIACCDAAVRLPMRPDSESLNATMAAGILLWEMTKSRLA